MRTPVRRLVPVYLVVLVGFLGYSLMIAVFTPMLLRNDNGMLAAGSSQATRSIVLGVLLSLYPLGQFLGAPILGALSDQLGRRPVLVASLASSTLWYGVIGAAVLLQSLPLLMVASFLAGLGEANVAMAQSSVSDLAAPADRNRLFGYVYLCSSLAYVIGPLGGGQLANPRLGSWAGYPTPFFVVDALLLATTVAVTLFFPEPRRAVLAEPRAEVVAEPGQEMTVESRPELAADPGQAATGRPRVHLGAAALSLANVVTDRRLRPLYLVNFLLYLAIFGFFRIYPMYLVRAFDLDVGRESLFVAWVAVPIVVANLWLVGWISRRWSAVTLTVASGLGTGVMLLVLPGPGVLGLLWLTLGLTALSLAICLPSCSTVLSLAADPEDQGRAMGNNQSLQVGAEALSGLVGGPAAAAALSLPFALFGVAAFGGSFFLWAHRPSTGSEAAPGRPGIRP